MDEKKVVLKVDRMVVMMVDLTAGKLAASKAKLKVDQMVETMVEM